MAEWQIQILLFIGYMILEAWLGETKKVQANSVIALFAADLLFAIKILWAMIVQKVKDKFKRS